MTLISLSSGITRISNLKVQVSIQAGKLHVESTPDIHVVLKKGVLQKVINKNLKSDDDEGNYEISEIDQDVQKILPDFKLRGNTILMKRTLTSSKVFTFTKGGMGQSMLGFRKFSNPDIEDLAFSEININNVNVMSIKYNIASGSFINGKSDHTSLHSFHYYHLDIN